MSITMSGTSGSALTTLSGSAATKPRVSEAPWQQQAACRGPHASVFFPPSHFERKDEKDQREIDAKGICASCVVRTDCLSYAIDIREPHGIWGGLTEGERRMLLARQAG
jgi:WhiB family transcriptional regulator, redox-sensing transcriptional regulator